MKKNNGYEIEITGNGSSLYINIPKQLADFFGIEAKDKLIFKPHDGKFGIFPIIDLEKPP